MKVRNFNQKEKVFKLTSLGIPTATYRKFSLDGLNFNFHELISIFTRTLRHLQ